MDRHHYSKGNKDHTNRFPAGLLSLLSWLFLIFAVTPNSVSWAAIPIAPSNLTATATSTTSINLQWDDNSTDEESFVLYRTLDLDDDYAIYKTFTANTVSYNDTGLVQNRTYYYRIRARNSSGFTTYFSAFSNEAIATTTFLTITAAAGSGGAISPSSAVSVAYGTNQTFNIIPNSGYKISNVLVDGTSVGAVSDYTFSNITSNHTISASFADIAAPTGAVTINSGGALTNNTPVTLTLSAADNSGAVSQMQFSNDNVTWSTAETYATAKTWMIASGDGVKTVYAKFKDGAGNWSSVYTDTIILDTTAPTGTVAISSGAEFTNNTSVTLTLSATDASGISEMRFSNDNITWFAVEAYATTKTWTLAPGDGTKTVYVKFKDSAGYWSTAYSDTIVLDTVLPTGAMTINNAANYTNTSSVTLSLSASDANGLSQMQFSNDNTTWSFAETYATTKTWTLAAGDGTKTVYVKFKDNAGNWSAAYSDTIILDTTFPAGSITINSGNNYTNSTSVTLTVSATDSGSGVSSMQFSNDGTTWSTAEAYATTKIWMLASSDGIKMVYAKFNDNAGNWSAAHSDTIILDTTTPTGLPHISAGEYHNGYLRSDGLPAMWGYNQFGQIGDGTTVNKTTPVRIGMDMSWAAIAPGAYHTIGLTMNGTLWAWGQNGYGQLGDGSTSDRTSPVPVGSDMDWVSVSAGGGHTVAIKSNGSLWTWGLNFYGQGGDGTTTYNWTTPKNILPGTRWAAVSARGNHTVAIKTDGTLWAWGYNGYGQLGDGTTVNRFAPVQIGSDTKWVSVSAGETYTVARKSDGTIWAWGDNSYGQCGIPNTTSLVPMRIGTGTNWATISAGGRHTVAVKSDGTLWAWGWNYFGQLGDGTTSTRYAPVAIMTSAEWLLAYAGANHTIALRPDGTVWAWGDNYRGQSGDGTVINTGSAVQPKTILVDFININGGAAYTNNASAALTLNPLSFGNTAEMQFSNDGLTWTTPEPFTSAKNWALSAGDGVKTVYVKFRDNAGNWSIAYSATIILDTQPSALTINPVRTPTCVNYQTLTGNMDSGSSVSVSVSTGAVSGIISYPTSSTWNCTITGLAAGDNNITVTVTDAAQNTFTASTSINYYDITPGNVAVSANAINTYFSESSTIFVPMGGPATVSLKMIPQLQGVWGSPVYTATQSCSAPGCSFIWNGKDSAGNFVPDEAYLYVLEASEGDSHGRYSPVAPAAASISCTQGGTFDPYKNVPLDISYGVMQPARAAIFARNASQYMIPLLNSMPHFTGSYLYEWYGRDHQDNIISAATITCSATPLPENVIITSGDTPKINQIKTDPYAVNLSYGEFTRIKYALSRDATVTVKITSPSNQVYTLENSYRTAGPHELLWPDPATYVGNSFGVSEEGLYTVTIQAKNPVSGKTYTSKGVLKVAY